MQYACPGRDKLKILMPEPGIPILPFSPFISLHVLRVLHGGIFLYHEGIEVCRNWKKGF
jgi:hypothetical protein